MRDSPTRKSNLTINGSLLALAEATSHESEIEVEENSSLTVNGLTGMFGSRIEIEASGAGSSLSFDGTLAIGMAQDLDTGITRPDHFEFEMRGSVKLVYDKTKVDNAVSNLTGLQTRCIGR